MDALATPFVQGRLRKEGVSVQVHTECGHCGEPLEFEIDSNLRYSVGTPGAEPLLFHPSVDWNRFNEPNIIHGF